MGFFTKDNEDDIDDIYDKLDDIYSKLEAVDVVTAFSSRLSNVEKTSSYLESVLMQTVKDLEKRINHLEAIQTDVPIYEDSFINGNYDENVSQEIQSLKKEISSLKEDLQSIDTESVTNDLSSRLDDFDEIVRNLAIKVSGLENSRVEPPQSQETRFVQYDEEIQNLKKVIEFLQGTIQEKDATIVELQNQLSDINKSIKSFANYIVKQAEDIKTLKNEITQLK